MATRSPPAGGDFNRANEVYAFTWAMLTVSVLCVIGRMYTRVKLTRNVWWDDWCICTALIINFIISAIWTAYAQKGYARHMNYLSSAQLWDAGKLSVISRSLCVLSIGIAKISVAFLIERIAGPNHWRKWLLRFISISIVISAGITFLLFYLQCQPVKAGWDKSMINAGTGKCWDPIPLTRWNQVVASYWAFLDFALAFIPVDMVWKLQLATKKKIMLSILLSMGIFAGICAAVKTSIIPVTIRKENDVTWSAVPFFMWGGLEMNVIIIAACIPTLRPLTLILFNRPGAAQYLGGGRSSQPRRSHTQYYRADSSGPARSAKRHASEVMANKGSGSTTELRTTQKSQSTPPYNEDTIDVNNEVWVESGDCSKVDNCHGDEERMGRIHTKVAGDVWA